ncbi:MAG: KpsF/GutQ family sugar-phosphate isomerase [Alphaproteobacteria bacterium]|nr:KpsF/GutQ family sugar-phosphate isomerase [Alphaproteobacteria bacterium]
MPANVRKPRVIERGRSDHRAVGRRVVEAEKEALAALGDSLGPEFDQAVERLAETQGRVVVSGMGKSGHVASKIAATMASTGTPAFYVHPGEASHGDLGMITRDDALLLLSNSGETKELADIVTYSRRVGIPLVAMVGRADSTLADAADVVLLLPNLPEACPMGLAPTTSTTAMLALGDALAIALLERKGFSAEDFQQFHPGGKLGRRLVSVAEIMHEGDEVPLVGPMVTMAEAILTMTSKHFGCVGVIDSTGALVGIITDGDLRRHMSANLLGRKAKDIMTAEPQAIRPKALAAEALARMNARNITSLFVAEGGKPIGIVHIHDCLRAEVE